jgi:hypothetical protein
MWIENLDTSSNILSIKKQSNISCWTAMTNLQQADELSMLLVLYLGEFCEFKVPLGKLILLGVGNEQQIRYLEHAEHRITLISQDPLKHKSCDREGFVDKKIWLDYEGINSVVSFISSSERVIIVGLSSSPCNRFTRSYLLKQIGDSGELFTHWKLIDQLFPNFRLNSL